MEASMKFKRNIFLVFLVFILCLSQISAQISSGCKYPETSNRQLKAEDLAGKTLWELKIMRNEIFARHGYKFKTEEMSKYFNKQKWYKPEYDDVTSKLTEIENANIKMIKQYEDNLRESKSSSKIGELIEKQSRAVVFKTAWGSGSDELGRIIPQEASPEGPMSFVIDSSGNILVLDQLNKRIQVYDKNGKHIKTIPIPAATFTDIAIGASGNLFLLDRYVYEMVALIDDKGNILKKIELIGEYITGTGSISEINSREDGLWVVVGNSMVRICDASGEPYKNRQIAPGRFSQDDKSLLRTKVIGEITATVSRNTLTKSSTDTYNISGKDTYTIYFDIPILSIRMVDTDKNGNIYLGVELLEESIAEGPPYSIENSHEIVVVLDSNGNEKKRIYMPVSREAEDVNRSHRVTPDGSIYQLVIEEEGATMWRYSP
jgi:hypothetical protein